MAAFRLAARLAGVAALFLAASGCLVNEDEFDQARRRREALSAELSRLRQGNDQLKHEINRLYNDRETLSGHVAMTAAVALHNQVTARLRPVQPPPALPARLPQATRQPPPPARSPQTTRPAAETPAAPPAVRNLPGAVDLGNWGQ
ncbi:MAG: septum formation initiator family protein [Candidatus Adiutrix sp.]|jgi:hypothetical protein|nr:septum formation initiator family protein [Candidatus Adiutrix sp.]